MQRRGGSVSAKTLDVLRRLVAERPADFDTRLHLAELLIDNNLSGEALEILEQALALKPDNPEALRLSAGLLFRLHLFEKSRDALEMASRKGPADPRSDLLLSGVYLQLGNRRMAEQLYNRAVKADRTLADPSYLSSIRSSDSPERIRISVDERERGMDFESERAGITFSDVGGMEDVKEYLRMNIIYPLKNPDLFKTYGKRVGGGIMMYGPPGCGKTYLSRALAGECNATFYQVGIHEILDMYLGSSEKNVHKLFETARRNAPAIVFLDEIDALGQKRSSGDSWGRALRGTVGTLLAEMDDLGSPDKPILVIGATNTPWSVDLALRRPGRFDRVVFVPPPDLAAREEILKLHLRGKPTSELDIARIAKKLEKYSGADIRALVDRAVEEAIKRAMRSGKTELITTQNLLDASDGMHPSTVEWLATAYDYVRYSNEGGIYDQVKNYLDRNR